MSKETIYPYVGIRPFNSDENLFFFGRDEQTLEILQRLHENHFVAVVGGSGSGKSSLIRAGLIPALKGGFLVEDSNKWLIAIMKPGQNPMYHLAQAILQQVNPDGSQADILDLVVLLKKEGVKAIINLIGPQHKSQNINFFLLIDQFEELFRFAMELQDSAKKTEAFDFVNMMLSLSKQNEVPFYIVLTMRSDFIGDCAQFHNLPEALNKSQYLIPRLNRQQLKMVIEGPAKLFGGKFSPALTSQLLNDLGNVKDELPLIQHALMRIWDYELVVDKNGMLDLGDYKAIGGFEKALDMHADEALMSLNMEDQKIAKTLFQALTEIDDNKRKIRRPLLLNDLKLLTGASEEKLLAVIDHFIRDMRAFLILEDTGEDGDQLIDISHESLIRQWDTLSEWVEEEGESAAIFKKLVEDSRLHRLKKKDLLTGSELQLALEWREKYKPTAIWANRYIKGGFEESMQYLEASEKERNRIKNIEKSRKKKMRYMWAALGALLVVITVSSVIATVRSTELAKKVNANFLRSEIYRNENNDPTYALRLADEAWIKNDPTVFLKLAELDDSTLVSIKEAEAIYHKNSFYKIVSKAPSDTSNVLSVAFSKDGTTLLTGSADGMARFRDLKGNIIQDFKGHTGAVNSVSFSSDKDIILTGSEDGTARLWSLDGKNIRVFRVDTIMSPIQTAVFSKDGKNVLTGSKDHTVRIWNLKGELIKDFTGHSGAINSIAFSITGDTILTGSDDFTARMWNWEGKPITMSKGIRQSGPITSVAFSPNGKMILTGSEDWTASLWNLEGEPLQGFIGHEGPISSAIFSPYGSYILTGSDDNTARLWQLQGELLQVIKGHTGPISALAFSPDGGSILSGSKDMTARTWELKVELMQVFRGHTRGIKSAIFSPNGETILTASEDKTARLWNTKGEEIRKFEGHRGTIYSVAFSPKGNSILTGSQDSTARLWDMNNGNVIEFKGHQDRIYSVAFSRKGDTVLTGSKDRSARLWDLQGVELPMISGIRHNGAIYTLAFSHDGKRILTGAADSIARLWDLNGNMLQEFKGHTGAISSVAFSKTGDTILTGSDDMTARLWGLDGHMIQKFTGHAGAINSVAFSRDGQNILTGSFDRTARLWSIEGTLSQEFKGHTSFINSVGFAPDGHTVLTGSYDNTARLWKVVMPLKDFLETEWGEPLSNDQKEKFGIKKEP